MNDTLYIRNVLFPLENLSETSTFLQKNSNMVTYSFEIGFIFDCDNSLQIECCILKTIVFHIFNSRGKIAETSYNREGILVSSRAEYFIT